MSDLKSNITLIIAVLGFIMSLAQWCYSFYSKRTSFSVSIEKLEWYEYATYNRAIFTLMIWNLSDAPLTLTRMSINDVSCLITHQWIGDHYYPSFPESDIPKTERKLSPDFPICIGSNGGGLYSIIFDFKDKSIKLPRLISFKIQTAHKKKNFILYCPNVDNSSLYL